MNSTFRTRLRNPVSRTKWMMKVRQLRMARLVSKRVIVWPVGSRLVGTLLAQVILVSAANEIVFVSEKL